MTVADVTRPAGGAARAPGPSPAAMLRALPEIIRDPLGYLQHSVTEYGPVVAFPVWRGCALLVDDPGAVRRVLQDNHTNYTKRTFQYTALALVTGNGLLTSDGATWRRHRRLVQPAFHRHALDHVAVESVRAAGEAGRVLDAADGPVDTDELFMQATLDVVGRALFGADLVHGGQSDGRRLVAAVHDALGCVMSRATRPWLAPPGLQTPLTRRLAWATVELDAAVDAMIEARRREPGGADVLGLLLAAADDGLTWREIRDELVTLVIAGHETVATSLTWTLRLVAEHADVQAAVHDELDRVLGGPAGRAPRWEDADRLPVVRSVVDEALRLFPPAWIVTRRAVADDELAGVAVPAGTLVLTSPWLQHRRPEVWPDPERFDPGRWTAGPARAHQRAYIPFGAGPRLCVGRDMAVLESVLVLAELLRTRTVATCGPRPSASAGVTLRPRGGSYLLVTRRESATCGE